MKPEKVLVVVDGFDDSEMVLKKTEIMASHSDAAYT